MRLKRIIARSLRRNGFVAQIGSLRDSLPKSIVIAGVYEQLDTDDIQNPELGKVALLHKSREGFIS